VKKRVKNEKWRKQDNGHKPSNDKDYEALRGMAKNGEKWPIKDGIQEVRGSIPLRSTRKNAC